MEITFLLWKGARLLFLAATGLLVVPMAGIGVAQEKGDVERAKALQRELNLNQDEMIRLLQVNREEMQKAMARLAAPSPVRFATAKLPPAVPAAVPAPDLGRDYRFGVLFGLPHVALAQQLKLEQGQGLLVVQLYVDSAAVKAGLKTHDVLVELDGKKVPSNFAAYGAIVRAIASDKVVAGVVIRQGVRENIKVTLPNVIPVPVGGLPPAMPNCPGGICPPGMVPAGPNFVPIQPLFPPAVEQPGKDKK